MISFLKRRRVWIPLLIVMIAAAGWTWHSRRPEAPPVLQKEAVKRTDILLTITATGRVQPLDQVTIGTEVSGTVAKLFVDYNQKVRKGQVLLELDREKAKSKVEQAQASYDAALTESEYQNKQLERTQALLKSGGATTVDLETAQYKARTAAASLVRSRNDLDQARIDLANCIIKSPIDGVILSRSAEVGQTVAASYSTPTLFVIARDLNRMEVQADVDEADIGQVRVGQNVQFTVDAYQGESFTGKISEVRLSPTITSNVVTYTVIIEADNPGEKLYPGMTANCEIIVKEALKALSIPNKALTFRSDSTFAPPAGRPPRDSTKAPKVRDPDAKVVFVEGPDGAPRPQHIKLGINDGVQTEVLQGLKEGDSVIVGTISAEEAESAKAESGSSSPFMPKRPKKKNQGGPPPM